jgi:hypothetical protein
MNDTFSPPVPGTPALKEWAIAVEALQAGKSILLLRKGGIRETNGRFSVEHQRVWLYPTYEHQKPHLLKPEYAHQITPVDSGWHPTDISILAWAEVTEVLQLMDEAAIAQLLPFHIWNERLVTERLHWKPRQPLYALLLRVYVLPEAISLPYSDAYGGCKSWIQLPIPTWKKAAPVLSDAEFDQISDQIRQPSGGGLHRPLEPTETHLRQ